MIREPLSGARDRTTLGRRTSAPIIVLTVQLYTYGNGPCTRRATACTPRVPIIRHPPKFRTNFSLFSSEIIS